jgi:Baseplate J-like protein
MAPQPPILDTRALADVMAQLQAQATSDLPQWKQSPSGDAGAMLQRIFARLMEIAIERLNRVPEKNLFAFLDAMGVGLLPPSAAQTALTFSLLKGSPPTLVPKGAQASMRASKQAPTLIFETQDDFTVLPATLTRAFTIDPIWDLYADWSTAVAGQAPVAFTPFVGIERMPHILYVGDDALLDCSVPVIVTLAFARPKTGAPPAEVTALFDALLYQYWSGGDLATATAKTTLSVASGWVVQVDLQPPIDVTSVQGVGLLAGASSRWLQLALAAPFRDVRFIGEVQIAKASLGVKNQYPLAPDLAFNDKTPLDLTKEFYPFSAVPMAGSCLYVASREAFAKPNCTATLNVNVKPLDAPVIAWDYFDGSAWSQLIGTDVTDATGGFSTNGGISLVIPPDTIAVRARLISGVYPGYPSITGLVPADTAHLKGPTSAGATGLVLDTDNFAAVGQVVAVDAEYVLVTQVSGNQLTVTPALTNVHSAGASVVLKLTRQIATLSAASSRSDGNTLLAIGSVPSGLTNGTMLLIDDPFAPEFVAYRSGVPTAVGTIAVSATQSAHASGTPLAVVGSMRIFALGTGMRADASQISPTHPFVPFGTQPGPGNLFILNTVTISDQPSLPEAREAPAPAPGGPAPAGVAAAAPAADLPAAHISVGSLGDIGVRNVGIEWGGSIWVDPVWSVNQLFPFGRQVQLNFAVAVQANLPFVDIAWEYLGASGWAAIPAASVVDNTNNFLTPGANTIELALGASPVVLGEVNSQKGYWIRARIAAGGYGTQLEYIAVDPLTPSLGYAIRPGSGNLHPPVLTSLNIDYAASSTVSRPPRVVAQNGFLYVDRTAAAGTFAPFVPVTALDPFVQADPDPAFYVGFDAAFPEQPTTLYVEAAPRTFSGSIVHETSLAPSLLDALPALRWEYFDGVAWSSLPLVDGTNDLTESGVLTFETPLDIALLAKFDTVPRYWIRARSLTNDPLGTQRLDGVFLNTTMAVQAVTVGGEVIGSSNGRANQTFLFARPPVLAGQQVTVREPEPPSGEEAAELIAEEGADAIQQIVNPTTGQTETWVRWHEVGNFLASAPYSRHYTLDHTTGTLVFGALTPPIGSLNIAASYRSGGGAAGNLPIGAVAQVTSTLPAVAAIANPTAADGGADPETAAMIADRGPQAVKHRGQAVAAGDIEWLAREAAGPRVARAKCIPNINQDLAFEPGWVTLLIVPNGTEAKPAPDSELIREVESFLLARAFVGLVQPTPARVNVIGPGYIRVAVAAEVAPVDVAEAQPVKQQVLAALAAYFHPLTGGSQGTGWPFGQPVYVSKVAQLIENVPGVDHVEALRLIPNIVQHRLTVAADAGTAGALALAATIATPDRSKSARVADATDAAAGRVLVKGFKEGDRITKVIDATVTEVKGNALGFAPFTDVVGMPRGSVVMTFDGLQRTTLAIGILPGQTVSGIELESPLGAEGDVITLVYPFPMTITAVGPETIELTVTGPATGGTINVAAFGTDIAIPAGTLVANADGTRTSPLVRAIDAGAAGTTQVAVADVAFAAALAAGDTVLLLAPSVRLDIESYDARVPFPAGSLIATLDNGVRLPLLQPLPAGAPVTTARLGDFAAGDLVAPAGASAVAIATVAPAYDVVAMDDNFLVYSGLHRITMVEA